MNSTVQPNMDKVNARLAGLGRIAMASLAAGLVLSPAGNAVAAAAKQNLNVSVTVNYGCNFQVSDMDFGTLSAVTGSETASARITVNCTPGALYLMSFSPSTWTTARASAMSNLTGQTINFNMNLGSSWGIGSGTALINGQLVATPSPQPGAYKSVETLYLIY